MCYLDLRTDSLITGGYKKPLILKKSQTIRKLYKSTTLHKKASLKDEQDEKAGIINIYIYIIYTRLVLEIP